MDDLGVPLFLETPVFFLFIYIYILIPWFDIAGTENVLKKDVAESWAGTNVQSLVLQFGVVRLAPCRLGMVSDSPFLWLDYVGLPRAVWSGRGTGGSFPNDFEILRTADKTYETR